MPKAKKATTVDFKGHELPLWTGAPNHPLIPTLEADIWYPPEHTHAIATAVKENIACLLIGETGTGKTSVIRELAFLRKQPYYRINLTGYTSPDELIGSKSAQNGSTYFEEGAMIKAMREGAILVMDEINATPPDCLFALHSLLDDERKVTLPTGTVVYPHPEFRFFATMNPDYEGTKSVNKALTDRFGIILDIKHLDPDLEKDYLKGKGIDKTDVEIMVMFATKARKAYQERMTSMFVSTRTLLQWGALVTKGLTLEEAFKVSVLNKLPQDPDMRRGINDAFFSVIKKNPKTSETEFGIYKKKEITDVQDAVLRMKEEAKQREGAFITQKADLVTKMQKLATKLREEMDRNKQLNALMPQLKSLMAKTPDAADVSDVLEAETIAEINASVEETAFEAVVQEEKSEFANTNLDIRK